MESIKNDIFTIFRAYLCSNYVFKLENNVSNVLEFSNRCGIGVIVAYTLKKNDLYKNESILDNILFYNVAKYEKQKLVRKRIKSILEENGVNFIFLKGSSLAKYYEEKYLRYSSDIDLIVEKVNYEKAKDLLLNNNFALIGSSLNELTLQSKEKVNVDLHSMFTLNDENIEVLFKDVKFDNGHELNNEYKYIFTVYHAAKHLKVNYISLQFLFDIYYLNKLVSDKQLINNTLKKMNLDKFNIATLQLIDYIMNENTKSELVTEYFEFLINTSNSKGIENMVLVGQSNEKSRINYLISRAFPKYEEMYRIYPNVKKNKVLLPYFYAKRIFDRIKQGYYNNAINEINASFKVDKTKVKETKKLFEEIGL